MAARLSDELIADLILEFGPDRIEAEAVGDTRIQSSTDGSTLSVTLQIKLDVLERELFHTTDLPERDSAHDSQALKTP